MPKIYKKNGKRIIETTKDCDKIVNQSVNEIRIKHRNCVIIGNFIETDYGGKPIRNLGK